MPELEFSDAASAIAQNTIIEGREPVRSVVVDLVGHVWQWCADTYRDHPQYRGGDTNSNVLSALSAAWLAVWIRGTELPWNA